MNATRMVAGSFAIIILLGTLLLMLPIASQNGQSAGFLTSLFTATSATCVTGLIPVDTGMSWTFFGQLVIILLIQVGGLGFMTVLSLFSLLLRRRIGLSERLIIASTLNLNDMDGVVRVVRHALMVTFTMEGIGAVVLSTRFIPQFGLLGGIWRGIFHAISAFCNAGFDLVGGKFGALYKSGRVQQRSAGAGHDYGADRVRRSGLFRMGGYASGQKMERLFLLHENGAHHYCRAADLRRCVLPVRGVQQPRHLWIHAAAPEGAQRDVPICDAAYGGLCIL